MSFLELKFSQRQRKLGLKISEKYTVRLLFKKIHNTVRHMNLPTVVLEKLHNIRELTLYRSQWVVAVPFVISSQVTACPMPKTFDTWGLDCPKTNLGAMKYQCTRYWSSGCRSSYVMSGNNVPIDLGPLGPWPLASVAEITHKPI